MSTRQQKRARALYHDSRRWLKKHPPRLSNPLYGLSPKREWLRHVAEVVRAYPRRLKWRRAELRTGGLGGLRKGPSAESVVLRCEWPEVTAVERALEHLTPEQRRRIAAVLWGHAPRGKADKAATGLFYRYVAVYLGYGRKRYDTKSA